jgi:hypothetical protein
MKIVEILRIIFDIVFKMPVVRIVEVVFSSGVEPVDDVAEHNLYYKVHDKKVL